MTPVKTKETNDVYRGPNEHIHDLPCKIDGGQVTSTWELSDEELAIIADNDGRLRITLHLGGQPFPPMSIQVVPNLGQWERVPSVCDTCGKPSEDQIHTLAGEGTHAFRCRK